MQISRLALYWYGCVTEVANKGKLGRHFMSRFRQADGAVVLVRKVRLMQHGQLERWKSVVARMKGLRFLSSSIRTML